MLSYTQIGTFFVSLFKWGRYIRPHGTYVGTVHMSGRYIISVYRAATVIAQISVIKHSKKYYLMLVEEAADIIIFS